MHVENELAEIMTIGDHEFEEVIKEYEEEILVYEVIEEFKEAIEELCYIT